MQNKIDFPRGYIPIGRNNEYMYRVIVIIDMK